ncbi:amidohydrolase family protein [Neomoorella thermoacetica]|uniref:amidohydrolase family protein n=1 Tax=Neomoorella thermoacetica TaxID=1525 RepID=UPI0008FB6CBA|nr:amidohydrolase family protein [Moorella thermoacetica]
MGKNLQTNHQVATLNGNGMIAIPGLVNTHHHLYQTLFRGLPEVQDMPLFSWLTGLYQFWRHLTPEAVYYGAIDLDDIAFTGCHDPVVALVCCGNSNIVNTTIVNGKIIVRNGELLTMDIRTIKNRAHSVARSLVERQRKGY